jgi:hypothetical protein
MARNFIRFSTITGPLNPSAALASGQPPGVATDNSFESMYTQSGASVASSQIFSGTGGAAGKSTPIELSAAVNGGANVGTFLGSLAAQTPIPRVCALGTSTATGGVATDWVNHYVLLRDAQLTNVQLQVSDDGRPLVSFQLIYTAAFWAFFATPSGGNLGARTASGWDWKNNQAWNGG